MFWKILGAVVAVWLLFVVLGWILKGLFWLLLLGAVGVGVYVLYKAMTSDSPKSSQRR